MTKTFVTVGMIVGSYAGSYLPMLWGGDLMAEIIWSTIGGVAGVLVGWKIGKFVE